MAEELEELWRKLSFTEEEDEDIELGSNSTKATKDIGKFCAVLKVLSHRSISVEALRKNLRMIWKPKRESKAMSLRRTCSWWSSEMKGIRRKC